MTKRSEALNRQTPTWLDSICCKIQLPPSRKKEERVSARKKEQQGNTEALNQPKLEQKVNISKVAVAECQDLLKRLFDTLAGEEDELEQLRTQVAAVTERRNGISAQIASSQNRLQQLRGNHSASLATKSELSSLREAVRNHQPTHQRPEEQDMKGCGHVPCDQ